MNQLKKACGNDVEEWKAVRRDLEKEGFNLFLIGDSLDPIYIECMDGLHTYNPIGLTVRGINPLPLYKNLVTLLHNSGKLFAATVVPGYDDEKVRERTFEPRRDGGYYIESWNTALSCVLNWIFLTLYALK